MVNKQLCRNGFRFRVLMNEPEATVARIRKFLFI